MEKLDGLKLAFDENGTVTAATSSPLTDGAAATLICEESYAKENNLEVNDSSSLLCKRFFVKSKMNGLSGKPLKDP